MMIIMIMMILILIMMIILILIPPRLEPASSPPARQPASQPARQPASLQPASSQPPSGSCRYALIGEPCRLRMHSIFGTFDNMSKLSISPQAKRAETDPRQGTPTRAHMQPPRRDDTVGNPHRAQIVQFEFFPAYPLVEIGHRSLSSDSRQQYLSKQYPPPLLSMRRISLLRLSLLRFVDSELPGHSLWAWEFHPLKINICLSQTLRSPES